MSHYMRALLPAAAIVLSAGCQELGVVNENNPDTARALEEPAAVESVIKSSFPIWYRINTNAEMVAYFPAVGSETATTAILRQILPSFEPRQGFKNDPVADEVWIPRGPWDAFNSGLANAADGLHRIINDSLRIVTLDIGATVATDNTDRARVFGKVMEGLNLGYDGLTFDRSTTYSHKDVLPGGYDALTAWERDHLVPYKDVITEAVALLDDAIADIDKSPAFTYPQEWINGQVTTSAQMRQFANSLIARLLVYSARTPEERAAVNWQKVLTATAAGLTFDFGPTLLSGTITNTYWTRIQSNTGARAHYSVIGPADTSGAYQAWVNAPLDQRKRFDIRTPDRRITGTTPTSAGAYFRYRADDSGFDATAGTYNFSAYQWYRNAGSSSTGKHTILGADENRLLRAEAMIRTGNNAEAANLINVSRTRTVRIGTVNHPGLPAVTAAGVPQSTGCVPRNAKTGACGTLMEALIYEREIETMGADPMRMWMDRRGLGTLVSGTVLHMPIPARYLIGIGVELYTFGGVGGPGAAK
jgi:hypothetical protein